VHDAYDNNSLLLNWLGMVYARYTFIEALTDWERSKILGQTKKLLSYGLKTICHSI